jgi:glycosyltransferase involved in cell wall biosynthesis
MLVNQKSKLAQSTPAPCLAITALQAYRKNRLSASVLSRWLADHPAQILLTTYNKDIAPIAWYKWFSARHLPFVYQQHMKVGVSKRGLIHTLRYLMIDLWISPLQYLKHEVTRLTRVPARKITVIPLGIEPKKFAIPLSQEAARHQLGLPAHAFIIGVLGRIDPKKGQESLIRALPAIVSQIASTHLIIMGEVTPHEGGAYLEELKNLVSTFGLGSRVQFLPFKNEVVPFYKAIDVFAMPSDGETYGMVTLEAMASGTPVVGTGIDGTAEILRDGTLGWLYRPGDLAGLTAAVVEIAMAKDLEKRTAAAREEILLRYTASAAADATHAALSGLLPQSPGQP